MSRRLTMPKRANPWKDQSGDAAAVKSVGRDRRARANPVAVSDPLLDVQEAAAQLRLKPATLYQWAYQRRIPVVKLGRLLRFRLSVIEQLIADADRPALRSA
jgi:excisionase family DNA binding protein